jgi:hypothetical protein
MVGWLAAAVAVEDRMKGVMLITACLLNRSVSNLDELRAALDGLQPHASVVLHIERAGLFTFLTFEVDRPTCRHSSSDARRRVGGGNTPVRI